MARNNSADPNAVQQLESFVDRLCNLLAQRDELNDDIKELKAEAKSHGFTVKALDAIVKEKRETEEQREARHELETITETYRAALGMLDGTPLGRAARERLSRPVDDGEADAEPEQLDAAPPPNPEDIAEARARGHADATAGKKIIDNPYLSDDPRRAAWDEGWCAETGSDGMDIPDAWKRTPKKKPEKPGKGDGV